MKKASSVQPVSNLDVLEAISDRISMDIITAISNDVTNPGSLMQLLDLSPKEYYSRTSTLLKKGLISKTNGEIVLTSFGRVIYNAQWKIANAFSHSSELRMIDAIKSHSGMSDDEQNKIIDSLLHDSELKNLIIAPNGQRQIVYRAYMKNYPHEDGLRVKVTPN